VNVLSASHLAKRFQSRQVVKDVSLQVRSGEVVGLLGPNGAGKTTSFYMIIGLIPVDIGVIRINREEVTQLSLDKRARMGLGYLPQESSIFRKLSVGDNIMAVLETVAELSPADREQRLRELLDEFQLAHLRESMGASLSGGERRRTEIARALARNPSFILLDEPFAGVDPLSVRDIQRIVEHLATRNIGILITDHNVRETLGICDRAYIVDGGTIISEGSPEAVLNDPHVRDVYLGHDFHL
jgi:lipopolysaccharide export system ATP-binding protein